MIVEFGAVAGAGATAAEVAVVMAEVADDKADDEAGFTYVGGGADATGNEVEGRAALSPDVDALRRMSAIISTCACFVRSERASTAMILRFSPGVCAR